MSEDHRLPALPRARAAMRERRYRDAMDAADEAIAGMSHGLDAAALLRFARHGADPDSLLRYGRAATARLPELAEPFAIRWEAAHRLGLRDEEVAMRELCTRLWPERSSVWAAAGNHALDLDELELAEDMFTRCLMCDPRSIEGLAGRAILCERRKDWVAALGYRRAVVEHARALELTDPASLHRCVRYAAALVRAERLEEAAPILARCVRGGAISRLPQERSALLHMLAMVRLPEDAADP